MRNIMTIAWNMAKRTIGSRSGLLIYIILPCIVVSAIITTTGSSGEEPAIVLYANLDSGAGGQHVIAELAATGDYKLVQTSGEAELKAKVTDQKGTAGVFIPPGYTEDLLAGKKPQISFYELKISESSIMLQRKAEDIAGRMGNTAEAVRTANAAGGNAESKFSAVLQQAEQHQVGSKRTDYNLYPRAELTSVTGFTLLFLMGLVTSSVSIIVKDRRDRTMMRMFSAPVHAYEIAIGNFLGSFLVGLIQIITLLTFTRGILGYDFGVPLYLYFLVLAAFILVSMGIASTITGLVRNQNNTGMLNALILTPTCMLGGCFWPISIMPDYMQKIANFVPQKWAMQAVNVAATGGGWSELWLPFAILGLMAAILLAIGSATLRPNEAGSGV
ncbi:ABC transporter permease [Paenibacillus agri]|uniref:ABC transporter permease n=1 Tax=Paenibacillus agri TaxID=2744309 RepID=A0A850ENS9_9BACL|nr:ABC transporter permease [Paenibacillus agri]NUU60974.1 ABC transporter permease [Paenibacillus agri]